MFTLHNYQSTLVANVRESFKANSAVLMVLPTGGGKTVVFSYMSSRIAAAGQRIIILVHRDELLSQVSETLTEFNVEHGLIAAGHPYDRRYMVHVASAMTLVNRLDKVIIPDYCIADEAHHCIVGSTWGKIFAYWTNSGKRFRLLGATATPIRLSGEGLGVGHGGPFQSMAIGPSPAWLIENGFLSKYRMYVPPSLIDRSALHMRAGEYMRGEADDAVTKRKIVGDVIHQYRSKLHGAPSILCAPSVKSAEEYAQRFREAGYIATSADGSMDKNIRRAVVGDFKLGKINVLTYCALFDEGFDCKGIAGLIDVSPTASLVKAKQRWGRTLRKIDGIQYKIIIDCVGNAGSIENGEFVPLHGMPDEDREWTLEGSDKKSKAKPSLPSPRQCAQCYAMSPAFSKVCQECGKPFEVKSRQISEVEGELTEIDPSIAKRQARMEQGMAQDLDSLMKLGIRKYGAVKGPRWARYVHHARQQKRGQRFDDAQIEASV